MNSNIEWNLSKKGNPYANIEGWNLAVFKRDRKRYGYRTQRRSPNTDPSCTVSPYSVRYDTIEEAKAACIQSIYELENRLEPST